MTHRQENKRSDTELSDKENKRGKLERRRRRFSSSSGSNSDDSSSDSVSSSGSSSSTSSSGSSSGSSSSSSTSSSSNYSQPVTKKTRVRKIDKTTVTARFLKEKKIKPLKEKEDKIKKAEKVKPKLVKKECAVSPRLKSIGKGLHLKRSPSPRSAKIHIGRLTRNVTREHIQEIFSTFGKIKTIDFPMDRTHPHLGKGFAYAEFETADEAENAMKHMDGAKIDGQEITAAPVLIPRTRQVPRHCRSPQRRPLPRWARRSALRRRHNSPPCARGRSPPPMQWLPRSRHRSRSPARRRRYSRSSSSKSG